jgi:hypothetical protein
MNDWMTILGDIFEVCIVPLLAVLTGYLVKYINAKSKQITDASENALVDKYVAMLADTITACVIATNQTYVEAMKKQNLFDADAQKAAFQMTYDSVMSVLTDEAKNYLTSVYGDLNAYIQQKIEAEVNAHK